MPVALPVERVVDHHALRRPHNPVVTGKKMACQSAGVGVDEPGLSVKPLAVVGIKRAVGLKMVELPVR